MILQMLKGLRDDVEDLVLHQDVAREVIAQPQVAIPALVRLANSATPVASADLNDTLKSRSRWQNYDGTQSSEPAKIAQPANMDDLMEAVELARTLGCPLRAVGSGHAWSDAALTDGVVLETQSLAAWIELDATLLRDPSAAAHLVQVQAGMRIAELNERLSAAGLALINMGGFDGQTIAGALSTSSHGSGITLGAYPSMVAALVFVTASGDILQVEPAAGISDPAAFKAKFGAARTLVQDDTRFEACVVSVGCLGVIIEVLLFVTDKYWLHETRTLHSWSDVRTLLLDGALVKAHRHVEVWVNPYKVKDDYSCLLTTRDIAPAPADLNPQKPFREMFANLIASAPDSDVGLTLLFNHFPKLTPFLLEEGLKELEDTGGYTDLSYKILNIGAANRFAAISAEYAVELDVHLDAVDAVLANAAKWQAAGCYQSGPVAIRYVAASPGQLSLQPRPCCMLEFPQLRNVFGAEEMLWRTENLLVGQFKARPHWGQLNFLTGGEMVRRLYPRLDEWLGVFREMGGEERFASRFTDRVGFTTHAPQP